MESEILQEMPNLFCWTRFGGEAAEPIESILHRKERERLANGGLFLWGIGNAVGPSISELMRHTARPQVIFSPIKTAPKIKDTAPPAVVMWTKAEGLDGKDFSIPLNSLVTSRFDPQTPKNCHYALVCFSAKPLTPLWTGRKISFSQLTNLRTGRPVGASQVTAVVRHDEMEVGTASVYDVSILAELIEPYFIRLRNASPIPRHNFLKC
jgi:hypothetical protein